MLVLQNCNLIIIEDYLIISYYLISNILFLKQTGARLVVHDPGEWPLVAEYGVDVKPDSFTLTAITQVSKFVFRSSHAMLLVHVLSPYS